MTELRVERYIMPAANLGKENPLPDLDRVGDAHSAIEVDEQTVPREEAKYMGWGRVNTIFPYTMQDGYDRKRRKRNFKAIVLENEHLKAVFLPELGGRLWSLFDKDAGRELLHVNPVFQPCNLALRNAWISGGVEWNCGIIGHTPFTVDDMATESLNFSDGTPAIRMSQYERVRKLFYRVEAFLPAGSRELYVRVRIDNSRKEDTAVYWWSNMAVNEGEDVRVIVPAVKAYRYGYGGKLAKVPVPYMTAEADKLRGEAARQARENGGTVDWDISRTTQLPQAMDFFFDVPDGTRPFIAAAGKDGYGMCQTSTRELMGRKLFVWGMGKGGRHWQRFLSEPGSAYIELQSGLAKTQLEHLPMAAGASISWLESYGAVRADAEAVHGPDWGKAVATVAGALEKARPEKNLEDWHRRAKEELDGQAGHALHRGMGSAHAEKALFGDRFDTAGIDLKAMRRGKAEKLWINLARNGIFPCPDPMEEPLSYNIGKEWEAKLREAATKDPDNWFIRYHLGVMAHADGRTDTAREEYERSVKENVNPWALRGLAVIEKREGNPEKAAELMAWATELKPIRPLAVEALELMLTNRDWKGMEKVIECLPEKLKKDGRITTFRIAALTRTGKIAAAEKLLNGNIVLTDVREGNTLLTDLWFELMAIREKGEATAENIRWAEENLHPPEHLDFRML